ncbi:chloride channel protein [Aurantibacter sp.]|uniref:chloride channel protein n=1 Tax=Aurantibacter sp. TaxID=2807103 RepID=UPI0035C7E2B7
MPKQTLLKRFLIWKYKHISEKNFTFILSGLVGFLAGLAAVTLRNITFYIESLLELLRSLTTNQWYFILPTIGLLLVYWLVKYVTKKPISHAIPSILYKLSKRSGIIERTKIYIPLIAAPLTVGFGGSVGLLGPAIASGSAISSNLGRLFHVNQKARSLLIGCAAAGAISSIFKSPIAAIIFAIEVFSLDLTFVSLLPLLIASVSSVLTSYFFLGDDLLFNFKSSDKFQINDTLFYVVLGIGTGIASIYFTKMYFFILKQFEIFRTSFQKLLVGGLAIGIMLYFIPPLYGEGFSFINNLLAENHLKALGTTPFDAYTDQIWIVIALLIGITVFKAIAMTTTFAAGGVGGIFIPTMVMGSALGNVVAKIINQLGFNVSETNFTLIGMAGLIAGVLHAPLTAMFLIAEISGGYELFIPLMISVGISFAIKKNAIDFTIYTKELAQKGQLLTHDKDQSVLTLMNLENIIETNFVTLKSEMTLGELLHKGVSKSTRNIFPVINNENALVGIIMLDNVRNIMFDQNLYNTTLVSDLMQNPLEIINFEKDDMKLVMDKFQNSSAWNLPVIKNNIYIGFVSKSKLLTAYRRQLINFTKQK